MSSFRVKLTRFIYQLISKFATIDEKKNYKILILKNIKLKNIYGMGRNIYMYLTLYIFYGQSAKLGHFAKWPSKFLDNVRKACTFNDLKTAVVHKSYVSNCIFSHLHSHLSHPLIYSEIIYLETHSSYSHNQYIHLRNYIYFLFIFIYLYLYSFYLYSYACTTPLIY